MTPIQEGSWVKIRSVPEIRRDFWGRRGRVLRYLMPSGQYAVKVDGSPHDFHVFRREELDDQ